MKPSSNVPSLLKPSFISGVVLALGLFGVTSHAAPVSIVWDIDNVESPGSTAPAGVVASSLATVSPASWTSDSSNGGWRTRGYTGSDDYVQFSLTTDATTTLTLESLVFAARCRAANTSGGEWTTPEVTLEYATDSAFTTPIGAGTLDLGADLGEGAGFGDLFTSNAGTFFSTDLTINPSETYYFRLRASNASGGTSSRNQLYYDSATDMTLNGDLITSSTALVWTGSTDNDWNTTDTNWEVVGAPGVPVLFASADDVTIDTAATVSVDGGGISASTLTVSAASGTVALSGGALTTTFLAKSGGSSLSINNVTNTGIGSTDLSNGGLQIEAGASLTTSALNLSGGAGTELIINDPTASLTVSGDTNLGATGGRIRVATGASLTLGTITTSAAGAKLDKRSDGSLTITGPVASDAFPIDLDVIGGPVNFDGNVDVWVTNASNPNSVNDPITLNGTQLKLKGVNFQSSGSITSLDSSTVIRSDFDAGNNTINVPVILTADLTVDAPTGSSEQSYEDEISGPGSLTKIGNGVVKLVAANSYAGTTSVEAGTLRIGNNTTTGTLGAGDVIVTSPGTLDFRRSNFLTVAQQISGDGTVSVAGAGSTIVFTGANSYTGVTAVSQGTLFVDGVHSGTGLSTVASGAAIGGNGSLAGDLTINAGGVFAFDALSTLTVSGTVTLDSTFGVDDLDGLPGVANGTYTLIANSGDLSSIENFGVANAFDLGGGQLAYFQGVGLELVVAPATTPFDDWMAQFTTLSGADLLATADPDGDNVDNVTEFAFDGNPEDGSNNGRIHLFTEDTLAATKLVLTVAVRTDTGAWSGSPLAATSATDGIDYTIEGTVDLSDFSSAVSEVSPVQDSGLAPLSAGYKWQSFALDSSVGLSGKGFLRAGASEVVE